MDFLVFLIKETNQFFAYCYVKKVSRISQLTIDLSKGKILNFFRISLIILLNKVFQKFVFANINQHDIFIV